MKSREKILILRQEYLSACRPSQKTERFQSCVLDYLKTPTNQDGKQNGFRDGSQAISESCSFETESSNRNIRVLGHVRLRRVKTSVCSRFIQMCLNARCLIFNSSLRVKFYK